MEKTICLRKERFFGNYDETYFTFNKNGTITIVRYSNCRGGGATPSTDFKDAIKSRDEFGYIMEEIEELITEEKTTYEEIYEHIKNGMHNNNKWYLLLAEYCGKKLGMSEKQVFEDEILDELVSDPRENLTLVDSYEAWMDGTCVKLADDDTIEAFVPGKKILFEEIPEYYKTVNIYKFSKEFSQKYYVPFLKAYEKALGENEYYEQVLRVITMLDTPVIKAKRLDGQKWYEIDDPDDLAYAEEHVLPFLI